MPGIPGMLCVPAAGVAAVGAGGADIGGLSGARGFAG